MNNEARKRQHDDRRGRVAGKEASVATQDVSCEILSCEPVRHIVRTKLLSYIGLGIRSRPAWICFLHQSHEHFRVRPYPLPRVKGFILSSY